MLMHRYPVFISTIYYLQPERTGGYYLRIAELPRPLPAEASSLRLTFLP